MYKIFVKIITDSMKNIKKKKIENKFYKNHCIIKYERNSYKNNFKIKI